MKTKMFIDYDDTIVNTKKAFCEVYNDLYRLEPYFVPADWTKNREWNFTDTCPLVKDRGEVEHIFCNPLFFHYLGFYDLFTKSVLKQLAENYDLYICTIGWLENIAMKAIWMKEHLPFVNKHIFINNSISHMDKSDINMANCIFIDDNMQNLLSSSASVKICFGKVFEWNKEWKGLRAYESLDLIQILGDLE
jgi:5'(3')-deoxyribonucleotidase